MVPHLGIVIAALFVPSFIGARIYGQLPASAFRRVVVLVLTASGLALVASALSAKAHGS